MAKEKDTKPAEADELVIEASRQRRDPLDEQRKAKPAKFGKVFVVDVFDAEVFDEAPYLASCRADLINLGRGGDVKVSFKRAERHRDGTSYALIFGE